MNNTTMNRADIMNDDNQAYWIDLVNYLNKTISQYGLGLIMIMGNIGSVLNCIVFRQPIFRNSPCAMYFIASSLSQILTFNFALFTRMLQFGYNVQAVNTILWFCKIRYYLFYIFVAIPRYNLILASIDRYFASSRDALRRQWSSQKVAIRLIIGNIFFWCFMYIQVIIFYQIENKRCLAQSGPYGVFFRIYIAIDSGILPILLMLIFGSLTVRNVSLTKRRTRPDITNNDNRADAQGGRILKEDAQLYRMLAYQIGIFIILNIMNPCYLVYRSLTINTTKSSLRTTVELFIENMTYVLIYLGFSLTFATFIVSSKMFRREFQQFVLTKIFHRPLQPETTGGRTLRTANEINVPH